MKIRNGNSRAILLGALAVASILGLPVLATAQAALDPAVSVRTAASTPETDATYTPPSETKLFRNYLSETVGPFALLSVAASAGVDQATAAPPQWRGGAAGYGRRFASEFGTSSVAVSTKFALSAALRQDPLYYPCTCKDTFARFTHAVISSFTARRIADGHRVFSIAKIVAPYAGTATAVYGWYPRTYGVEAVARLGSFYLAGTMGANIFKEFFSGDRHTWLSQFHLSKGH